MRLSNAELRELRAVLEKNLACPRQPVQTFDPLLPNYARPERLPEKMSADGPAHPAIPGPEHDPADWSKDVLVKLVQES